MSKKNMKWERRKEQRKQCDYKHIFYSVAENGRKGVGWLNDQSLSGISFVTLSRQHLNWGQDLKICFPGTERLLSCKIVRISKLDKSRYVIGCKKEVPGEVILPGKPRRKIVESRLRFQKPEYAVCLGDYEFQAC